jgi:hypothetical protein
MPDPGRQVGEAHIKVSATGVPEAKSEVESLREEIRRLSDELMKLKQAADQAAGIGSGTGAGAGGQGPIGSGAGGTSGLAGLSGRLRGIAGAIGAAFGAGSAAQAVRDIASEWAKVNIEVDKYATNLTRIRGDAAQASGEALISAKENIAAALGLPSQSARSPGPNTRAVGGVSADATTAAAEALQAARTKFDMFPQELATGDIAPLSGPAEMWRRFRTLQEAQSNYSQTVRQQQAFLNQAIPVARTADAYQHIQELRAIKNRIKR